MNDTYDIWRMLKQVRDAQEEQVRLQEEQLAELKAIRAALEKLAGSQR